MWKTAEHSDEENITWAYLRAIEWGNYPAFITQPIIPILLVFLDWKLVLGAFIGICLLWNFAWRYKRFLNAGILSYPVYFVMLRWIANPVSAYYLYTNGQSWLALMALLWSSVSSILANFPPPMIGKIQRSILEEMGYEKIAGSWARLSNK